MNKLNLLFKSWENCISNNIKKDYFLNLLNFLDKEYKKGVVFPFKKRDIFKPFQVTPYEKLKVVIIGDAPVKFKNYNGLGFGVYDENIFEPEIPKALSLIKDTVEFYQYNGLLLDFDYTLEKWAKQGVLLLNYSMTTGTSNPHYIYWRKFMEGLIKGICESNSGIHFLFWGDISASLSKYVTGPQYIYKGNSLIKAVDEDIKWSCNHFGIVNNLLKESNGPLYQIEW